MSLCQCGCGELAPISPVNHARLGYVKGQPRRFIRGHQFRDPATRQQMAESRSATGNEKRRGRKMSDETRAKISAATMGRSGVSRPSPKSEETRARISASLRARAAANPAQQRVPARDGDGPQARQRIRQLVRAGVLPPAASMPCTDCGQAWELGKSPHEYDHHHGYGAEHHGCAEVVCCRCHHAREKARGRVRKPRCGSQFDIFDDDADCETTALAFGRRHLRVVEVGR